MTLFFNLDLLEKEAGGDLVKFLVLLNAFHTNRLPSGKRGDLYVKKLNLTGSSYLLNPKPVFTEKSTDIAYIVQYIRLAAKRDYSLYKYYELRSLPISYCLDMNIQALRTNPLLNITQTDIFFKYEELKKET
jgi:hypothetical protein